MTTSNRKVWAFPVFLCAFLLALFAPVLGYYTVLMSPDSAPHYSANHVVALIRRLIQPTGGQLFHPGLLPALTLPPLVYHDLHYALCTIALCAAMIFYLRGLRLSWPAALCGGFAMAFSGYHFTLISAGHRGYFDMMPWAILMLACVDRAIRTPKARYTVTAVIALGFGLTTQPDVMALFVMLTAVYTLVTCTHTLLRQSPAQRKPWVRRLALAGLIALPALFLATLAPLGHVFLVHMPGREAQIVESAAGRPAQAEAEPTSPDPEDTWIFATNWSLPPGESLEFVAPFFWGIESFDPNGPYWGALGRSPHWDAYRRQVESHLQANVSPEQHVQQRDVLLGRARNYRQHTTYLGGIPLLFGLLAGIWCWRPRRQQPDHAADNDALLRHDDETRAMRTATRFWTIAAIAALLLAFGRHTPVYRLFFALPMMDKLRAPVKFLHVTEVAVAVLFAVGIQVAQQIGAGARYAARRPLLASLVAGGIGALLLLVLAAASPVWQPAVQSTMTAIGFPLTVHPMLIRRSRLALLHGGLVLGAGTVFLAAIGSGWIARYRLPAAVCLLPVLALDAYLVCSPYIRPLDVSAIYRPNPVVDTIRQATRDIPPRTSNLLGGTGWQDPLSGALRHHRIRRTEPGRAEGAYAELYQSLSGNPARLWQATGTGFVIGEAQQLAGLARYPGFEARLGFDLDRLGRVRAVSEAGRFLLVERRNPEPFAQVFYDWSSVKAGQALNALQQADAPLDRKVWIEDDGLLPDPSAPHLSPDEARVTIHAGQSIRNRTRLTVGSQAPGVLLLQQGFNPALTVQVNGRNTPLFRANHAWSAIPLDRAGEHQIVIEHGTRVWRLATAVASLLLMLAVCLPATVRHCRLSPPEPRNPSTP